MINVLHFAINIMISSTQPMKARIIDIIRARSDNDVRFIGVLLGGVCLFGMLILSIIVMMIQRSRKLSTANIDAMLNTTIISPPHTTNTATNIQKTHQLTFVPFVSPDQQLIDKCTSIIQSNQNPIHTKGSVSDLYATISCSAQRLLQTSRIQFPDQFSNLLSIDNVDSLLPENIALLDYIAHNATIPRSQRELATNILLCIYTIQSDATISFSHAQSESIIHNLEQLRSPPHMVHAAIIKGSQSLPNTKLPAYFTSLSVYIRLVHLTCHNFLDHSKQDVLAKICDSWNNTSNTIRQETTEALLNLPNQDIDLKTKILTWQPTKIQASIAQKHLNVLSRQTTILRLYTEILLGIRNHDNIEGHLKGAISHPQYLRSILDLVRSILSEIQANPHDMPTYCIDTITQQIENEWSNSITELKKYILTLGINDAHSLYKHLTMQDKEDFVTEGPISNLQKPLWGKDIVKQAVEFLMQPSK